MEHISEKPLIIWEFVSSDWKTIYKAWIYDYFEECNCKWFQIRKNCKHIKELIEKLKQK